PVSELGESVDALIRLELPRPNIRERSIEIHVIHVDRFGNLVTSASRDGINSWAGHVASSELSIRVGSITIAGLSKTYADVAPDEPVAYFGSSGRLEIGVRNGSAARALGIWVGDVLTVNLPSNGC